MDVFALAKKVENEEVALEFARELGLVRKTAPGCRLCGELMKWERGVERRGVSGIWRCLNKIHARTSLSLFDGSVLRQFQVPVSVFLKVLYCIAQRMTVKEAAVNARMSGKTCRTCTLTGLPQNQLNTHPGFIIIYHLPLVLSPSKENIF